MSKFELSDPTEEELAEFQKSYTPPPAPKEVIAAPADANEPSDVGDFLKGLGQGVTLGFGDEILAAIQATVSPEQSNWLQSYREKQKEYEQSYREAQERSPWLTLGGEFAGGLALPGTSALRAVKAAGVVSPVKQAMAVGGIMGSAAGLGASEGMIEQTPGKLLTDTAIGGATGAAFGGVLSKSGQMLKEYAAESPKIQRALRAFTLENKGMPDKNTGPINLTTEKGQDTVLSDVRERATKIAENYIKYFNTAAEDLNEKIATVADQVPPGLDGFGPTKKSTDFINSLQTNRALRRIRDLRPYITDPNGFMRDIDPITKQEITRPMTISDLLNLREKIKQSVSFLSREKKIDDIERKQAKEALAHITDYINQANAEILPAYETKRQLAYPIEALLANNLDEGTHHRTISKLKTLDLGDRKLKDKVVNAVKSKIFNSSGTGSHVIEDKAFLAGLEKETTKRINKAIQTSPILETKILDQDIMTPKEIQRNFKEAYENLGALEVTEGMRRTTEEKGVESIAKASAAGATGVPISFQTQGLAQILGKTGRVHGMLGRPVEKTRDLVKTYGIDKLKSMANALKNSTNKSAKAVGEHALTTLDEANQTSRAAFLNTIMQNPNYREILGIGREEE